MQEKQEYQVRSTDAVCVNESQIKDKWYSNIKYRKLVQNTRNVQISIFSHVWRYRKRCYCWNDISLDYQKI
jgi:hypothetical protein